MPYRVTLGHIFAQVNNSKDLESYLKSGGVIIDNAQQSNILALSIEKNLDACTSVIILELKKRVEKNIFSFGFITHKVLESLNFAGSEMLFQLYQHDQGC